MDQNAEPLYSSGDNMSFSEIDDPQNLCRDITVVGHHSNEDIEVRLSSLDQLDDVMELIRQAFEENWEV